MTDAEDKSEIIPTAREQLESLLRDGATPSVIVDYLESLPSAAGQWMGMADSMHFDRLLEPALTRRYTEKVWYNLLAVATATEKISSRRWFIIRAGATPRHGICHGFQRNQHIQMANQFFIKYFPRPSV